MVMLKHRNSKFYLFLEAKASKGMHQVCIEINHLTATYPYIRAENSSTGCTSKHVRGFCKLFDISVFCFTCILNQSFKALNFRFRQVSKSFDYTEYTAAVARHDNFFGYVKKQVIYDL